MPKQVLIVDDSRTVRTLLRVQLKDRGYIVHAAANGKEALEHLDSCEADLPEMPNANPFPCVILLDAVMPEMDGYTFVKTLQGRRDGSSGIPIICLTSREKLRSLFEMEGVHGFVEKTEEGFTELLGMLERL